MNQIPPNRHRHLTPRHRVSSRSRSARSTLRQQNAPDRIARTATAPTTTSGSINLWEDWCSEKGGIYARATDRKRARASDSILILFDNVYNGSCAYTEYTCKHTHIKRTYACGYYVPDLRVVAENEALFACAVRSDK